MKLKSNKLPSLRFFKDKGHIKNGVSFIYEQLYKGVLQTVEIYAKKNKKGIESFVSFSMAKGKQFNYSSAFVPVSPKEFKNSLLKLGKPLNNIKGYFFLIGGADYILLDKKTKTYTVKK